MIEIVKRLTEYTGWADGRMFDALAPLGPEAWTRDLNGSLKSVRDTAVHLVSAQWVWVSRWGGTSPRAMWDPVEFPTPPALRERWEALAREHTAFVAAQTDATLAVRIDYRNLKGEPQTNVLGELLIHVANHSTYHRGQVTTLVRQLGAAPVSSDYTVWLAGPGKR